MGRYGKFEGDADLVKPADRANPKQLWCTERVARASHMGKLADGWLARVAWSIVKLARVVACRTSLQARFLKRLQA
jgi:hypothetical protein